MKRDELLIDTQRRKKDAQPIFVCNWHPSLSQIPTILKQHYQILESDERMSNIFPEKPLVAYHRPKTTRRNLTWNDIHKLTLINHSLQITRIVQNYLRKKNTDKQ